MATQSGPIKVLHFGLGPIGAAIVRQVAGRKGFKIVGAVDIDPAKVGSDLGEVAGVGRTLKVKVVGRRQEGHQGRQAGRGRAVHQLVAEEGPAADRSDPEAQGADRLDDRGAGLPDEGEHALRARGASAGEEGQGGRARHRRQPRIRHGRAADHADRRLRARGCDPRRSHPGCARSSPAVPAEDRRRSDARAVSAEGRRRRASAMSGWPSRCR